MTRRELPPIPYNDALEEIPVNEAENIQHAVQSLEAILLRSREDGRQVHGHIHAKTHGVVRGEFRVLPNLPVELAQGLFATEHAYQATARFSNSASQSKADYLPDGRGMAIKVLHVDGERVLSESDDPQTQDFVMINHPVFFARDVEDFLRLEEVAGSNERKLPKIQKALTGGDWNPLHWHWQGMANAIKNASHLPTHPASNPYFSMVPIRFGKYVAKYRAVPAGDMPVSLLEVIAKFGTQADAMRLMLEETLAHQQILFEFQVQLRVSENSMPVEDATVEWPENLAPYRTVALFLIPRQDMKVESSIEARRALSFNVWHAIADHRPLGGINRLRKAVYPTAAAWRLSETDATRKSQ